RGGGHSEDWRTGHDEVSEVPGVLSRIALAVKQVEPDFLIESLEENVAAVAMRDDVTEPPVLPGLLHLRCKGCCPLGPACPGVGPIPVEVFRLISQVGPALRRRTKLLEIRVQPVAELRTRLVPLFFRGVLV